MRDKSAPQDHILGMGVEGLRHPMWTRPTDDEKMPKHIRDLRTEIARRLTPLDGRQGAQAQSLVQFHLKVWTASALEPAQSDPVWLAGMVAIAQSKHRNTPGIAVAAMRLMDALA